MKKAPVLIAVAVLLVAASVALLFSGGRTKSTDLTPEEARGIPHLLIEDWEREVMLLLYTDTATQYALQTGGDDPVVFSPDTARSLIGGLLPADASIGEFSVTNGAVVLDYFRGDYRIILLYPPGGPAEKTLSGEPFNSGARVTVYHNTGNETFARYRL